MGLTSSALDTAKTYMPLPSPSNGLEGSRTGVLVLWEDESHLRVCFSLSVWTKVSQLNMMDGEL